MTYTNIFSLLKRKIFGNKKEENIIFYNSVTVKNYNNYKKHKDYFYCNYNNSYDDYNKLSNDYYSEIGLSLKLTRSLSLITNQSNDSNSYSNNDNYDTNDNYDNNYHDNNYDNNYHDNYDNNYDNNYDDNNYDTYDTNDNDIINQIIQLY
jgi:hypothetical protein